MALSFTQRVALAPSLARRRTPRASSVCAAGSSRKRSSGAKKGGSPPGPRPQPAGARPQQPPARVPPPGPPPAGAAAQGTPAAGARVPPASQVRLPAAEPHTVSAHEVVVQAAPSTPSANGVASSAAPRDAVVNAALSTSLGLSIVGMASRNFASSASLRWPVPDLAAGMPLPSLALDGTALQLPTLELSHVGYALAVAAGVTAARAASLALWPAFHEDSERANSQVRSCGCTCTRLRAADTCNALARCSRRSPRWTCCLFPSPLVQARRAFFHQYVPENCSADLSSACSLRSSCFGAHCFPFVRRLGSAL